MSVPRRSGRVAEAHAARLSGLQGGPGAIRDQPALLLGDGGVDVQHERIGVRPELRDDERHTPGHQASDEGDVAAQPVELGDDHRAAVALCLLDRRSQLRPALDGVVTLAGLGLGEGRSDTVTLELAEAGDRLLLSLEAEARTLLAGSGYADVGDDRLAHANADNARYEHLHARL